MTTATLTLPCLTFNRKAMLAACKLAANCVAKADIKPILQHLKLSVSEGAVIVSATNLEQSLCAVVPLVKADRDGECLISASDFVSTLQACSDDELELSCSANPNDNPVSSNRVSQVVLKGNRKEIKFQTADPSGFPDVPMMTEEEAHIEVSAPSLLMAIGRVGSEAAAANEKVRFATNSISMDLVDEGLLTATTTNGYGMSTQSIPYTIRERAEGDGPWLLPVSGSKVLESILRSSDGSVLISLRKNEIVFSTSGICLTSRLMEGLYPKWRKFIPRTKVDTVSLVVGPLREAISLAVLGSTEDDGSRRVALIFTPGELTIRAAGVGMIVLDSSRVDMDIEYDGPRFEKHFSRDVILKWMYRLDASTKVVMEMHDNLLFRTTEERPYLQMCMPLIMPEEAKKELDRRKEALNTALNGGEK